MKALATRLTTGLVALAVAASITLAPQPAQAKVEGCLPNIGTNVPVLFVHGLMGDRDTWGSQEEPDAGSMIGAVGALSGVYPDSFDYGPYGTRWVTDENIGPKLAEDIACRAQSSREQGGPGKVIIVAHSMGGLATRFAANEERDGSKVAGDIGLVVTIGTPNLGSGAANAVIILARSLCAMAGITGSYLLPPFSGLRAPDFSANVCENILSAYTAFGGLRVNSQQLAELPELPSSIPVQAIAGHVQQSVFNIFGVELVPTNGDLIVGVDSARFGAKTREQGGGETVVECVAAAPVPIFSGANCEHTRQLRDPQVQSRVVDSIRQYLHWLQQQPEPAPACLTLQEANDLLLAVQVPAVVDTIACEGDWAIARDNELSGVVLFRQIQNQWTYYSAGSYWEGTDACQLAPESIRQQLAEC
jgi:pimeloyl-ACP methyl ester carboxylesterase